MNHLEEAKRRAERAICVEGAPWAQFNAQLGILHVLIALVERLEQDANFEEQIQLGIDHPLYKDK